MLQVSISMTITTALDQSDMSYSKEEETMCLSEGKLKEGTKGIGRVIPKGTKRTKGIEN